MGGVADFADFGSISASEVGARDGQERVECGPERPIHAVGEVRRRSEEPARVRGNWRDQASKNPNRERLGFQYWWWDGTPCQTRLKVRNASPAGWRELLRKRANPPYRARTFKRIGCRTGCYCRQINSAEDTVSSIPICGIEPASAQVAERRKGRSITA